MKKAALWLSILAVGAGLYFLFERSWTTAAGLVVGSIIIDVAIDEGLLEFEKWRGKVD